MIPIKGQEGERKSLIDENLMRTLKIHSKMPFPISASRELLPTGKKFDSIKGRDDDPNSSRSDT